jgi:hypothetical protein
MARLWLTDLPLALTPPLQDIHLRLLRLLHSLHASITRGDTSTPLPPGRFPHQGSWSACGGNASGTSHCRGNGNCGPLCCECGAGTHWTCCGCPRPSSTVCPPPLSLPHAICNHFIFRSPRSPPTPCSAIPGISLPPPPPPPPPPPSGPQCNSCINNRDAYNASADSGCFLGRPPQPVCLHLQMKALPFITPQKGDAWKLWQQQQQQQQRRRRRRGQQQQHQPSLFDLLNDDLFGKVFQHLADTSSSHNYSHSLLTTTRLCSAYRRAHLLEKTFNYGHVVLGCNPALVPPPAWFCKRRHRISSVTAPQLPPGPLADVLAGWGAARHTFTLKVIQHGACAPTSVTRHSHCHQI